MKHFNLIRNFMIALLMMNTLVSAELKKGHSLKAFSLISIEDKVVTLKVEEGKLTMITEFSEDGEKTIKSTYPDAVLIDFWATWCVPCRAAYPHLQKLSEKFKPKKGQDRGGAEVIGISIDRKGSKVVKPFIKNINVTYTILADSTGKSSDEDLLRTAKDVANKYKVVGIPVVYLIDSAGIIQHVHIGFKKEFITEIESVIQELVSEE